MRLPMAAVVAGAVLAGACDDVASGTDELPDASIAVLDNFFSPSNDTVPVGGRVRWAWSGQVSHNVVFDNVSGAPAHCDNQTSGTCTRTFETAGEFPYVCTLHNGMTGRVTAMP